MAQLPIFKFVGVGYFIIEAWYFRYPQIGSVKFEINSMRYAS